MRNVAEQHNGKAPLANDRSVIVPSQCKVIHLKFSRRHQSYRLIEISPQPVEYSSFIRKTWAHEYAQCGRPDQAAISRHLSVQTIFSVNTTQPVRDTCAANFDGSRGHRRVVERVIYYPSIQFDSVFSQRLQVP